MAIGTTVVRTLKSPPKPLIRFVLVASLLASVYVIFLMAHGIRQRNNEALASAEARAEEEGPHGPPRMKHMKAEEEEEEEDEEEKQRRFRARQREMEEEQEEEEAEEKAAERREEKLEEQKAAKRREEQIEEQAARERKQRQREKEEVEKREQAKAREAAAEKEKRKQRQQQREKEEQAKREKYRQKVKEEEAKEEKKQKKRERVDEILEEKREKARIEREKQEAEKTKEEKAKIKPKARNFHYKTDDGAYITIMNPYAYKNDQSINCVRLDSAKNKEAICTYKNSEDKVISRVLNGKMVYQSDVVETMKGILKEDPELHLIDIGANLGVFTLTAASMGRKVIGVEPFPPNLKHLAKTMRQNKDLIKLVKIITNPLSNQYETMHFWREEQSPGGVQVHAETEAEMKLIDDDIYEEVEDLEVHSILTDDLLELIKFKKAILKVDIEGAEYKALQSSYKLFEKMDITHVFLEWDQTWQNAEKRDFFLAFFKVRDYTVHEALPGLKQLELSDEAAKDWPFDVVFIKH